MRKQIFLLCFCLLNHLLFAQSGVSKSIEKTISKAKDMSFQNIDSALFYAQQALHEAQKIDSPRLVFHAQRAIGLIYEDNNRLSDAQKHYASAVELAKTYLPADDQLTIFTDWAIVHKKLGQYKIAEEYHRLTIDLAEKTGNWEVVENGYHGLGTMYSMTSDFDKSLQSYLKSIEAAERWGNQKGIVLTCQNISNIHLKAKNYDLALKNIVKTYSLAQKLGDSVRLAAVLRVYGNIELAVGNLQNALLKHQAALNILENRGDKPKIAESYLAIANIYFEQKKYAESEAYFNRCAALQTFLPKYGYAAFYNKKGHFYAILNQDERAIADFKESLSKTDSSSFKEIARDNCMALANILQKQKRFEEALQYMKEANRLGEALFNEDKKKEMTDAQFKFETEKRDLQITAQNKQIENARLIRWLLGGGLLIMTALSFFSWRQMTAKQRAFDYAELLLKELHHRVKNNLQTITSIMRLQSRKVTDPSVSAIISESRSRLEAMSMIHQQLYRTDNVKIINIRFFIDDLIEKIKFTYSFENNPLDIQIDIENENLDVDMALPLGLILNELLTNSCKYAYPSVCKPKMYIRINKKHFYYADNGSGLPPNFDVEKSDSFGMHLIVTLAQQLRSKYRFYNDKGLVFEMIF